MIEALSGKYRKIRRIGRGGMAEIYLVLDVVTGERKAAKILSPDNIHSYANKARFKHEIELTSRVNSPYVVRIFDWKWTEYTQYIIMEYIDGDTLKDYIESKTRLVVDEAVEFGKQLTLGFIAIHKEKITHRDIKATNIMVTGHGQIKIIDFGIAITKESDRHTKADSIIASPQYIAPELVNQEEPTEQSDIYSLGILLYEMLAGSVPYMGKTPFDTVIMHQQKTVPMINRIYDDIPQSVANVIVKATAKKKQNRYKNMAAFYDDLSTCLSKSRLYEEPLSFSKKKRSSFKEIINSKWTVFGIIAFFTSVFIAIIAVLAVQVF